MFISYPHKYERNVIEAAEINADTAVLQVDPKREEPAVVIRRGSWIVGVMPIPEALRFANEIADAVTAHKNAA